MIGEKTTLLKKYVFSKTIAWRKKTIKKDTILFVRRAYEPEKGAWSLPGGFLELGETLEEGAKRELKEETNLNGEVVKLLGTCSHFNSVFGDILLIGIKMNIENWDDLKTGDDAYDATFFKIDECPELAFECHQKIFNMYIETIKWLWNYLFYMVQIWIYSG